VPDETVQRIVQDVHPAATFLATSLNRVAARERAAP
jgi:hypothetical protein